MQSPQFTTPGEANIPLLVHLERFIAVVFLTSVIVGGIAMYGIHSLDTAGATAVAGIAAQR